jgi:hypothetical protein
MEFRSVVKLNRNEAVELISIVGIASETHYQSGGRRSLDD